MCQIKDLFAANSNLKYIMYICSDCSFAHAWKDRWISHEKRTGHQLQVASSSDDDEEDQPDIFQSREMIVNDHFIMSSQDEDEQHHDNETADFEQHDISEDESTFMESNQSKEDSWYPWSSRCHYYLTVLYHGSHRRNIDKNTLIAIMDILKVYVPKEEYFPNVDEIVNFTVDYWKDQILHTINLDGNPLTLLKPQGIVALRLANPVQSTTFDRVPRRNTADVISSQSSAAKFKSFEYRKLGNLMVGDLVELDGMRSIATSGPEGKVSCKLYFYISGFYIEETTYKVEGKVFIHSSVLGPTFVPGESGFVYLQGADSSFNFQFIKYESTFRFRNLVPFYTGYMYLESSPLSLFQLTDEDLKYCRESLHVSANEGCLRVLMNLHVDDASQVSSKMWKSASVCDIQFAGAISGVKGNEYNNIIVALSDTEKISMKRVFDVVCEEFIDLGNNSFECYDSFTGKKEKVKVSVAAIFGDLPAKAEISPFKGYKADVFCGRDMYNKRTGDGLEIVRTLDVLREQIIEIQTEVSISKKKKLGIKYGLDINNLECPIEQLDHFDMTRDFPQDLLHHFTLGWCKKSLVYLKTDVLSENLLLKLCEVFDCIVWKEYTLRTTSNALKKVGSQIGRNIKALMQIVWYGMWILLKGDSDLRAELEVFLRAFFYLGKLNFIFFNAIETAWCDDISESVKVCLKTVVAIFRRDMDVLVPGPKTHDLENHLIEDVERHGSPAGFDCQAGESKMKVQKYKNHFSNKKAPSKDVAEKYLKTEIVRHTVTGGALNSDGSLRASENVMNESKRLSSLRSLLGISAEDRFVAKPTLADYIQVGGKKRLKQSRPKPEHILLGIPDSDMKTFNRVKLKNGPLYRGGGLYMIDHSEMLFGRLIEVYRSKTEISYAVIEVFDDCSGENSDPFLNEAGVRVWRCSGILKLVKELHRLNPAPILHACPLEPIVKCGFEVGSFEVIEERQKVQQHREVYRCLGKAGNLFLINVTALCIPSGVGAGCM